MITNLIFFISLALALQTLIIIAIRDYKTRFIKNKYLLIHALTLVPLFFLWLPSPYQVFKPDLLSIIFLLPQIVVFIYLTYIERKTGQAGADRIIILLWAFANPVFGFTATILSFIAMIVAHFIYKSKKPFPYIVPYCMITVYLHISFVYLMLF